MVQLQELIRGIKLRGILPNGAVTLVDVRWSGSDAVAVIYTEDNSGRPGSCLLYRSDEPRLEIVRQKSRWRFNADGALFRLVSEAQRIRLAHLFDPFLAIHTSLVDPYPHQITAVYQEMLPRQPLRFLLADDPGAGKTIMAGLLIKELMIRGDLQRCLIVVPGNLAEQWQLELYEKFQLDFEVLTNEHIKTANTGNVFEKMPLLIARVDKLKRDKSSEDKKLQQNLKETNWDLIICDEAHKMSASFSGNEVKQTKRYKLGQLLSGITRHFLLMTATPHNGKKPEFQLFMALLDRDRFEGKFRNGFQVTDTNDIMRRVVKEDLVKLDGTPLLPERKAYSVTYCLSDLEYRLYQEVTKYVEEEFNRAETLEEGRKRSISFALTILQRRLASSPGAIYQSLQRRRKRLEDKLRQQEELLKDKICPDWDELEDLPNSELEQLEDEFVDRATAARNIAELQQEIYCLQQLEIIAQQVLDSGIDRKREELSKLLQNNAEMFNSQGQRRKIIVFTEHRDTLDYLVYRLKKIIGEQAVVTIHGKMNLEQRRQIQKIFNENPSGQILVATDAAGEGINLQESCHLMVNYDLPWNPNRIEQRFGRIHRIGQTEVCHLWNLVAEETREGDVYLTLLEKLEEARKALGGKVFDILGEAINGEELKDLLIDAIRYGERPDVQGRLEQVIEERLNLQRLQELLQERSLTHDSMDVSKIRQIREEMERAETRKLQPFYTSDFFLEAFQRLGGRVQKEEFGRYEISFIPVNIRNRLTKSYRHICFDKQQTQVRGKSTAEFVYPGHPLLDATIDLTLEPHRDILKQGSILVDENDPGDAVRILVYLEHAIRDARQDAAGNLRLVSMQMLYVEIDSQGQAHSAGYSPYLDYRPLQESEKSLVSQIIEEASSILQKGIEEQAQGYASDHLGRQHYQEVQQRRRERITKTINAVEARLSTEISYWENKAEKLKLQEQAGKLNARLNYDNAQRRVDELKGRLQKRLQELEQERQLLAQPPVIVGGTLIVPGGLIQRLQSDNLADFTKLAREKELVEKLAIAAVIADEKRQGFEPKDVSASRCGYDIESHVLNTGQLRFIKVKSRIYGASSVTVTRNEIITALNKPDSFILALVEVPESEQVSSNNCNIRYVRRPFHRYPEAVTSVKYNWQQLWLLGRKM
ncbi:helicase-related protein [Iningainema tapete]|uniref:DEAD/DEAH box helicase family protein n=1 Tax=Iningainema tapete BLCC-T55 TaxID=2748662 RepID=A0A8J6XQD5_9CYAN|nr:helicase-related protein [Iningainema tapete]MBD2777612.1 DEAD/DEAH box helicase family protein [Iningainema tapete BLCC-T55]